MPTVAEIMEMDPALDAEGQLAMLGVSYEDVMAELAYRRQAKIKRAYEQQALAAKAGGTRRVLRAGDIGGEVQFCVHPIFYHYWGQRLGYECWDDAQFVREFLRDNPSARVKSVSDRLTIVKPEMAKVPGRKVQSQELRVQSRTNSAPNVRRGVVGRRGRWAA